VVLAAWITFGPGALCAAAAAVLLHRREHRSPHEVGIDVSQRKPKKIEVVENRVDEIRSDPSGHTRRLAQLFPSPADDVGEPKSGDEIRACADVILSDYDDAPVRSFVLTLAERRIRDCLREQHCPVLA
jgi:hypothetical protein